MKSEVKNEMAKDEIDFDSIPMSDGKDESVSEGTFICESHEVRDVIVKETGRNAGKKLFLKGKVKETDEEIEVSQAICEQKDRKIREAGMWVKVVQGKIRVGTTVTILKKYKIPNIGKVDGKKFKVVRNKEGYWIINGK